MDAALVAKLQGVDEVLTAREDLVVNTCDWWARTMVAETGGKPATVDGVFVRVSTVEQVQAVMRLAHEAWQVLRHGLPGAPRYWRACCALRGGIVLDVCNLNWGFVSFDADSQIVEVEAGMFGDIFEEMIQRDFGMTMGHYRPVRWYQALWAAG